ncbi:MAG TPA: alpha/beta hydrolase [Anaerolineae bacterium]|nr:alpha/beta hydrolase [Anaerolineae bacterium]HQI86140.1 alpha/beta hydrolase [Anaerolineae bacterium]
MRKGAKIALWILGVILFLLLVGPYLIPVPPLEGVVPPADLADPDSQFIELAELTVHYKMQGTRGPDVLLLHGFASNTYSWTWVTPALAEHARVIAFDRPAFGLTERPLTWERDANPYTPEAQIACTIGLMDALGIERAVLIGNSAGGTVALATALAHPERVSALVLVDAAIYTGGNRFGALRRLFDTPQMRRIGPLIARQIQNWGYDFGMSAWHDPAKMPPDYWENYTRPLRVENWDRALWELTRASRSPDLTARFAELALPILVITGDDDRIVPTAQSVRLAEELPGAQLAVIPNCGHVPQEECPDAWLEAVLPFVADVELSD